MLNPSSLLDIGESCVCSFVIPGEPVPWARAVPNASGPGFHTRSAQKGFKRVVADYARVAMLQAGRRRPLSPLVPVRLSARIFTVPPKSFARDPLRARASMDGKPCLSRPDFDNWVKLPMDAMQGVVFEDDSQVWGFVDSGKFWDRLSPRLELAVFACV